MGWSTALRGALGRKNQGDPWGWEWGIQGSKSHPHTPAWRQRQRTEELEPPRQRWVLQQGSSWPPGPGLGWGSHRKVSSGHHTPLPRGVRGTQRRHHGQPWLPWGPGSDHRQARGQRFWNVTGAGGDTS